MIALKQVAKAPPASARGGEGLSEIDLSVDRGEFLAIVSASEWTRTVLLDIIGLLAKPDSGSYEFDGRAVAELGDRERAQLRSRRFGFVFREPRLMGEFDIEGNVMLPMAYSGMPRHLRTRRARELLERVGLGSRRGDRIASLSAQEARLVSIARALANDPTCLLFDDPGPPGVRDISDLLAGLHGEGLTIVVASPIVNHGLPATKTLRIDRGRIVAPPALTAAGVG